MQWLIGQWDDIEREWLDVKHVEASSPETARDQFGADFSGDAGEYGVKVEDTWVRFEIPVDGPMRWIDE